MQGYFELKTYQQTEPVEIENTRVWLTNVFVGDTLMSSLELK